MFLNNTLFFIFSFLLLFSSITVVLINNSVYAVLFTIMSFLSAVCLLLLLESEFMALIFIVIYIGAIAVLFLFVVMMLNIKLTNSTKDIVKYFPISNFIGLFILIALSSSIFKMFPNNSYINSFLTNMYVNWLDKIDSFVDIQLIGQVMYTHYVLQFLIAGFILLIAIIGASTLTLNFSQKIDSKLQKTFKQVSR